MWSFGQKEKVLLRFSVNLCFYSLPVQMLCESCYFLAFPSQKNGFFKTTYLCVYFWLCWVFVARLRALPPAVAAGASRWVASLVAERGP